MVRHSIEQTFEGEYYDFNVFLQYYSFEIPQKGPPTFPPKSTDIRWKTVVRPGLSESARSRGLAQTEGGSHAEWLKSYKNSKALTNLPLIEGLKTD